MGEVKDVRLQVFITPSMDDRLADLAGVMGMSKNELVRYAIASVVGSYEATTKAIRQKIDEEFEKTK